MNKEGKGIEQRDIEEEIYKNFIKVVVFTMNLLSILIFQFELQVHLIYITDVLFIGLEIRVEKVYIKLQIN